MSRAGPVVACLLAACSSPETSSAVPGDAAPDGSDAAPREDAAPADGGTDAGDDAGPWPPVCPDGEPPETGCGVPDEVCPEDRPVPGAPCVTGLACEYREPGYYVDAIFAYTCESSSWTVDAHCDESDPDYYYYYCNLAPPLAESCVEPFGGRLEGALVQIGPASATESFRPFEPGEHVGISVGGQGAAMLAYRFRVGCVEAPECVLIRTTVRVEGEGEPTITRVALHCGESTAVYALLLAPCGHDEWNGAEITLEIPGIGEARAEIQIPGCYE